MEILGAHYATHGNVAPRAATAPSTGSERVDAVRARASSGKRTTTLASVAPVSVDSSPEAWDAFRKFHDNIG